MANISRSQAQSGQQKDDGPVADLHRSVSLARCDDPLDRRLIEITRQCPQPISSDRRKGMDQRGLTLASGDEEAHVAAYYEDNEGGRARCLCDTMGDHMP